MSKDKDPIVLGERAHGTFNLRQTTALPGAVENVCCEAYNAGDEDVIFTSIHPDRHRMWFNGKPPLYWNRIVCKPQEWVFLPHGMYMPSTRSGKPSKGTLNFGETMFTGNKYPSRPEAKKIRVFNK